MSTRAHIMLAILVAMAILVIVRLVRRRHLKAKYSLLWLTLGGFMVVIAAVPGLLDWTAARLGIYYQPTLLILLGLALLLLIVMHFSYELSRMENRVRTLAEESAILRHRLRVLEQGAPATTPGDASGGAEESDDWPGDEPTSGSGVTDQA